MLSKVFISIFFYLFFCIFSHTNANIFIVYTVENEIITNHDISKEINYLKVLNPKITQLNDKQIQKIAKDSLINEIIKKKEIQKILDFDQENSFVDDQIKILYNRLNFTNESDFKNYLLNSSSYEYDEIKNKIKIEIMWNELIYSRYRDQVYINKEKLLKRIDSFNKQVRNEYNLSEIVFKKEKNISLNDQIKKIKDSINEIGFNNTANIYSTSENSKLGGDIGWIDENNLSEIIYNNVKDLKENEMSDPIQIGNSYLLLKINKIRQKNVLIDKEIELKKMIQFETNKQLNQFSKIFFEKTKMNYSINEK